MVEFRQAANAVLVRDLLPVLDNLERAAATPAATARGLRSGVELVLRQFKDALAVTGWPRSTPIGHAASTPPARGHPAGRQLPA